MNGAIKKIKKGKKKTAFLNNDFKIVRKSGCFIPTAEGLKVNPQMIFLFYYEEKFLKRIKIY